MRLTYIILWHKCDCISEKVDTKEEMSSGLVSRMWFSWVPPKMRDVAIFSECRKRDVPVGNLSSRNNSRGNAVFLLLSRPFRSSYVSTSLSSSVFFPALPRRPSGIQSCPHYNGISCLHVILTISRLVLHVPSCSALPSYLLQMYHEFFHHRSLNPWYRPRSLTLSARKVLEILQFEAFLIIF